MHQHTESLVQTIASEAYLAAYGGAPWSRVAQSIAAAGGCDAKVALRVLPRNDWGAIVATSGFCEEALKAYGAHFGSLNCYDPVLRAMRPGDVVTAKSCGIDVADVARTEYGSGFIRQYRVGFGGTAMVSAHTSAGRVIATVNYDDARSDELDPLYSGVFQALSPHLAQAVRIAARNARSAHREGVTAALSTLHSAALVLSGAGRVVGCNAAATTLLADGPLFVDRAGRLRASNPAVDARLEAAITSGLSPSSGCERLRVADFGAVGELVVVVSPLPDDPCEAELWGDLVEDERAAAVVHLVTDPPASAPWLSAIRSLYELSEREAVAAEAILKGRGTRELATCLGLSSYEAALLRESVKERLGVRTSADVVRRLVAVAQFAQDGDHHLP